MKLVYAVAIALLALACAAPANGQQGGKGWRDVGGGVSAFDVSVSTTCYAYFNGFSCVVNR